MGGAKRQKSSSELTDRDRFPTGHRGARVRICSERARARAKIEMDSGRTVDVLAHRVLVVAGSALVGAGLALLGFVGGILGGVRRRVGLRKDD